MDTNDIVKAQEELLEESQEYFEDWYEREEEFRRKFVGEEESMD